MKNTNFNLLARPSAYDTARALANRDDAKNIPYVPVAIPKMKYPQTKMTPTAIWALIRGFAP